MVVSEAIRGESLVLGEFDTSAVGESGAIEMHMVGVVGLLPLQARSILVLGIVSLRMEAANAWWW